jgi:hypothetical protein
MKLPRVGRAVFDIRLAQLAQLMGTYDSKTDQTDLTDQRVVNLGKFFAHSGQKPTSCRPKLTSGSAQQPHPCTRGFGRRVCFECARPSDGAPQP